MSEDHGIWNRLGEILIGNQEAETNAEKYMVITYERARIGDLLHNVYSSFPVQYESLSVKEKDYFMYGYAVGQQRYVKEEMLREIKNEPLN